MNLNLDWVKSSMAFVVHINVHLGLTEISCRYMLLVCTVCFVQPRCATDPLNLIGDRAFSIAVPPAWNTLPTELKLLRSTTENISV